MNVVKFEIRKNINRFLYSLWKQGRQMSGTHRDGIRKRVIQDQFYDYLVSNLNEITKMIK